MDDTQHDDFRKSNLDENDVTTDRDRSDALSELGPRLRTLRKSAQHVDAVENSAAEALCRFWVVSGNSRDDLIEGPAARHAGI